MIPRTAHFVFGLREQTQPFHLLHHLAIASCRAVLQPDEIVLHVHHLPWGIYWDLTRPLVTLARVEPVPEVDLVTLDELTDRFRYAHHADVIRLDVLARHGGLYADIDTLFLRPVPDRLWAESTVLGAEDDVRYDDASAPQASVSNALMMAEPDAPFITEWRDQIIDALDGSWSGHSCRLATRLVAERPDQVHVEPRSSFSPYPHTVEGARALLDEPLVADDLDASYSAHLCAHLWWDDDRRDFAATSATTLTEHHLRTADTAIAALARPHLPDHDLF